VRMDPTSDSLAKLMETWSSTKVKLLSGPPIPTVKVKDHTDLLFRAITTSACTDKMDAYGTPTPGRREARTVTLDFKMTEILSSTLLMVQLFGALVPTEPKDLHPSAQVSFACDRI